MMLFLTFSYIIVLCLFLIAGYTTTSRKRLHLGLYSLASLLWPLSLVVVIGLVCAEKLGVVSKPRRFGGQPSAASKASAARGSVSALGR
jgi:hypothetical protein